MKRVEVLIVKEVETAAEATALINSIDAAYGVINAGFRTIDGIAAPAAQAPAPAKKKASVTPTPAAPSSEEKKTYTFADLQAMTSQIGTLGAKKAVEFSKVFRDEVLIGKGIKKLSDLRDADAALVNDVASEFVTRFEKEGGKLNG